MAAPELLLLRHGIASERRADADDALRPLTPAGRERTARVLQRLRQLELGGQRLLSSPLLRARQTAELALAAGLAPALELAPGLAPEADPWPLLHWPAGVQRLLLVGHEPDLGDLAAALIGAPPGAITLKKAGIALLELHQLPSQRPGESPGSARAPRPGARLRLLLGPRQLLGER